MKRILLSLVLALLASSCAVYAPKTALIPQLEQRGDLQVAAALDASTGLAFSAAGAVSDHIGVQLSGDLGFPDNTQQLRSVRPAVGYFRTLPNHLSLGAYAGTELASCRYVASKEPGYGEPYDKTRDYRTTTLFGQADLVWAPVEWVSLCARLTLGNFHYDNTITLSNSPAVEHAAGNSLLVEPTAQLLVGGPRLKGLLSVSYAYIPAFPSDGDYYYRPLTFGLGLTYKFNPFK